MLGLVFGLFFLVIFGGLIAGTVFWIMKIVEVAQIPDPQYRAAGTEKTVWILIVVLVGLVGALIWQFAKRQDVLRVRGMLAAGYGGYAGYSGYGGYAAGPGYGSGPGSLAPPTTPAGWYPEPGTGWFAYWDGYRWTGARRPPEPAGPPQPTRVLPEGQQQTDEPNGPSLRKRTD